MSILPVRHTARLILLDPRDRMLLIQYEAAGPIDATDLARRDFWYTPGGGLEEGETHEEAAKRELMEEVGIAVETVGPCVALRSAPVLWFRKQAFTHARFFWQRVTSDNIDTSQLAITEGDPVLDVRWWPVEELAASNEIVAPPGLLPLVRRFLAEGLPAEPVIIDAP